MNFNAITIDGESELYFKWKYVEKLYRKVELLACNFTTPKIFCKYIFPVTLKKYFLVIYSKSLTESCWENMNH